jgi:hypothetical protein
MRDFFEVFFIFLTFFFILFSFSFRYRDTMEYVDQVCSNNTGNSISQHSAANSILGLLQQLMLTTVALKGKKSTTTTTATKKEILCFQCVSGPGVALRRSTSFGDRYTSIRGPDYNDYVRGKLVKSGTIEWIHVVSTNSERNGKYLPILGSNGETFFKECVDPITGGVGSSGTSSSFFSAPSSTTSATSSSTTTPASPGGGPPRNMRTISGSIYNSKRNVARYPYVIGPTDIANSDPWGGQGYFTESPVIHDGVVRSITLRLGSKIGSSVRKRLNVFFGC